MGGGRFFVSLPSSFSVVPRLWFVVVASATGIETSSGFGLGFGLTWFLGITSTTASVGRRGYQPSSSTSWPLPKEEEER